MPSPEHIIEAHGIEKFYSQPQGKRIQVIAPTDLVIDPDQIVVLLGPSGSGKSTLLRILTGLAAPSAGVVLWHGVPLDGQQPNVSIVFQSFALFPWLTVIENVEAPLLARGIGALERRKRALKILDTVGLDGFEMAYPRELSGGMKQRVGVARALAVQPEVLFMDEPFSSLDVLTAENLRTELLGLWLQKKIPTRSIFIVTHNIEEAILLADRVVVLGSNPARIRADFLAGLDHPRDRKSAQFIDLVDYIYCVLTQPQAEPGPVPAQQKTAETVTGPSRRLERLPHARPGSIAGLLELLDDRGGRDDLHRLAEKLVMEIDDLLPIVEAAVLLGFLRVQEGDAALTPSGWDFAKADIDTGKRLFRKAALERVQVLQQMASTLAAKSDHTVSEEFFLDVLEEHFSEDEARRQLETAILWGRYAEVFDYDSESGRLFLGESTGLAASQS